MPHPIVGSDDSCDLVSLLLCSDHSYDLVSLLLCSDDSCDLVSLLLLAVTVRVIWLVGFSVVVILPSLVQ